ncbi:MAG: helix-turn-helix transcriptional regulator [Actinobacteria bacterium]|nr:helix-turn-helix transcriptional regulator [Actinomycetota bacterium]
MSDKAIVRDIGKRIRQMRLNKNISQKTLSEKIGIHRVTLSKIERGQQISLLTLIQIMRGLGELQRLENIVLEDIISPIQLAKLQGKKRKRASRQIEILEEKEPEW